MHFNGPTKKGQKCKSQRHQVSHSKRWIVWVDLLSAFLYGNPDSYIVQCDVPTLQHSTLVFTAVCCNQPNHCWHSQPQMVQADVPFISNQKESSHSLPDITEPTNCTISFESGDILCHKQKLLKFNSETKYWKNSFEY